MPLEATKSWIIHETRYKITKIFTMKMNFEFFFWRVLNFHSRNELVELLSETDKQRILHPNCTTWIFSQNVTAYKIFKRNKRKNKTILIRNIWRGRLPPKGAFLHSLWFGFHDARYYAAGLPQPLKWIDWDSSIYSISISNEMFSPLRLAINYVIYAKAIPKMTDTCRAQIPEGKIPSEFEI